MLKNVVLKLKLVIIKPPINGPRARPIDPERLPIAWIVPRLVSVA